MSNFEFHRNRYSFVSLNNYTKTNQYFSKKILPLIDKSSIVWDAGCGRWNRMLLYQKGKALIGSDIEFDRVINNKMINNGVVGDIEIQMFQDDVFDIIVSNDVVEHLKSPDRFIQVCYRYLKINGYIVIATPNRNSLFGLLAAKLPNNINKTIFSTLFGKENLNEVHFYKLNTENVFRKLLLKFGFTNIDITYINKLSSEPKKRMLWGWYYQLCKIPLMRRFSPGLFCIAQKTV